MKENKKTIVVLCNNANGQISWDIAYELGKELASGKYKTQCMGECWGIADTLAKGVKKCKGYIKGIINPTVDALAASNRFSEIVRIQEGMDRLTELLSSAHGCIYLGWSDPKAYIDRINKLLEGGIKNPFVLIDVNNQKTKKQHLLSEAFVVVNSPEEALRHLNAVFKENPDLPIMGNVPGF